MVREKRPNRKRTLKRRSSWKDTLRNYVSGGENDTEQTRSFSSTSTLRAPSKSAPGRQSSWNGRGGADGSMADGESDQDEEDFDKIKEEDRPISARIVYNFSNGSAGTARTGSDVERQQQELSVAIAEADNKVSRAVSGKHGQGSSSGNTREPVGTRLTMTSRTGYFQDRIISPSMVCDRSHLPNKWIVLMGFFVIVVRCVPWLFFTLDPIEIPTLRLITTSLPFWRPVNSWHNSHHC